MIEEIGRIGKVTVTFFSHFDFIRNIRCRGKKFLQIFHFFSVLTNARTQFLSYIGYHRQNCTVCTLSMTGGCMLPDHIWRRNCMNNLNSILIEGNLVKDPQLRTTPKGTSVCTFRLASNRFFKQDSGFEREVSFFDVETWAKLAEACSNKGKKGRGVRVVGRLKEDRWTGNDGKPRSRVAIVAEHVEFRPEFRRENAVEKTVPPVDDLAAAAMADEEDNAPLMEREGSPVMTDVLEPVMF
jgi:single-strand DNA-binding protein